jgi:hypothetical protein
MFGPELAPASHVFGENRSTTYYIQYRYDEMLPSKTFIALFPYAMYSIVALHAGASSPELAINHTNNKKH